MFNLLDEKWIPVRRRSGLLDSIAPWQIAESTDPPLHIESPRSDFDGALIQFLIGLVQTAAAPASARDWRKALETVPDPQALRAKFDQYRDAFNLDGPGPRFMQDLTFDEDESTECPIRSLLIDGPGENTEELNKDLFIKRDIVVRLGLPSAAMALLTIQMHAPQGGVGHFASLRGGAPVTTVLIGSDLWSTVWLNVLKEGDFVKGGRLDLCESFHIFPWLDLAATFEGREFITPEDVHPAHQFWAMPRRVRLGKPVSGRCSLTGREGIPVVQSYAKKKRDIQYKGAWLHPLTPYRLRRDDSPLAVQMSGAGMPYRDWPDLVLPDPENNRASALVVQAYQRTDIRGLRPEVETRQRLWTFGFDMHSAAVRCWYSGQAPLVSLHSLDEPDQMQFTLIAHAMVQASERVRETLEKQVLKALFRRRPKKADLSHISQHYWGETATAFFGLIMQIRDSLQTHGDTTPRRERWLHVLHDAAKLVFESHSQLRSKFAATDVERIACAWNDLLKCTAPTSPALRKILVLSTPSRRPVRPVRKADNV